MANQKKCHFGQRCVEYLGHIVSTEGVAMDTAKVQGVLDWPIPKTVKGVRGFLGLTGYSRKFIKDYGKIARPLTELTKKQGFPWGPAAQTAFEHLKQIVTEAPVLCLPDFGKEFIIECDAARKGIGAVLMQDCRPIAFFSKALTDVNSAKPAYRVIYTTLAPLFIGQKIQCLHRSTEFKTTTAAVCLNPRPTMLVVQAVGV